MSNRWRSDPVFAAREVIGELRRHGVELPADVADAYKRLEAITDPPATDSTAVTEAIIAGKPVKDVQQLLLAESLADRHRAAVHQARHVAGSRVMSSIKRHAAELHEALRPLAESLIAAIEEAGALGNLSIETLIRDRRTHDAEVRAELPENEAVLKSLYRLRNTGIWQVNTTSSPAGIDCSELRAPLRLAADIALVSDSNAAGRWYNQLAKSGSKPGETLLWWPTPEQWSAAGQRYTDAINQRNKEQHREFVNLNRAMDLGLV
jgi:hypothetical protein